MPVKRKKQKITSDYGPRSGRLHRGIDLRCVNFITWRKQPFIATEKCQVTRVKRDGKDNGIIVVKPLNAYSEYDEFKYIHVCIEKSPVTVGKILDKGDVIGYSETRGQSKSHHLHFEVIKNGEHEDPKIYFDKIGIKYV